MKTKLLLLLAIISFSANAQSPIFEYYGQIAAAPEDGTNQRTYYGVSSATPLDHSPSGPDAVWTFNLTSNGESNYLISAPTAQEISDYPGTNKVATNTVIVGGTPNVSKAYFAETGTSVSFTGAMTNGLVLNYETNNAKVGDFQMVYGYSNTDTTAGNYDYNDGEYSGTFTGTITTNVDAYGVLNSTGTPFGPLSDAVTRMKTVQTISLNYGFFSNIGTVVQTTYHYFRELDLFPYFTATTTTIQVALLGIDETVTVMEQAIPVVLGASEFASQNLTIAPNPTQDLLLIQASANLEIQSLKIMDLNGRIVSQQSTYENAIDVSNLTKGVYFAEITTDSGKAIKKFVKD